MRVGPAILGRARSARMVQKFGGEKVVESLRDQVTVEHEGRPVAGAERVAFVAHFSSDGRATKSFQNLIASLQTAGYVVVVSSASQQSTPLSFTFRQNSDVTVLRRPNIGYDFGSWALAFDQYPQALLADKVLVLNDSMVGPFDGLGDAIAAFESSSADLWGLTSNYQFQPHLQSYFLGFRGGLLASNLMKTFWNNVRVQGTKDQVIQRYELGLSRVLLAEGYILEAAFDAARVVGTDFNPVIVGWDRLLRMGYPFVKRELLSNPDVVHDGGRVPLVIRQMFGENVEEWL